MFTVRYEFRFIMEELNKLSDEVPPISRECQAIIEKVNASMEANRRLAVALAVKLDLDLSILFPIEEGSSSSILASREDKNAAEFHQGSTSGRRTRRHSSDDSHRSNKPRRNSPSSPRRNSARRVTAPAFESIIEERSTGRRDSSSEEVHSYFFSVEPTSVSLAHAVYWQAIGDM